MFGRDIIGVLEPTNGKSIFFGIYGCGKRFVLFLNCENSPIAACPAKFAVPDYAH